MIIPGTILRVSDKTGVVLVKCIKILGTGRKTTAYVGDTVLVSVQLLNPKRFLTTKLKKKKNYFSRGSIHRALIIRTKFRFQRAHGITLAFSQNSVVLVNKKNIPLSNRAYGPVLRELCMKVPALGSISMFVI